LKVTIDLDQLLLEGKITQAEYDRFSQFAARSTAALAFNILIGFGVIAVSGAAVALIPAPTTALFLGFIICGIGLTLIRSGYRQWVVLANICLLVGALLFASGVLGQLKGSLVSFLIVAAVYALAGIFARSSLLAVLAVLALSSCLGAETDYLHAMYFFGVEKPTLTVVVFTAFSIGIYQLAKRLNPDYQPMAIAASRTGVFLVNLGFWIGSLWGDDPEHGAQVVADWVFAAAWAIALLAAGVWAWRRNRRWLLNVVAVFGGIHFYTQWFERLGASPATVLVAGLLALTFAFALRTLNARLSTEATEQSLNS
jgi:hypothetical protein